MTRIALGEVQAFALGLALDFLDNDPDLGAAAAAVQAMVDPPIAEPEDLLLAGRRSLVITSREDAEHVWIVCRIPRASPTSARNYGRLNVEVKKRNPIPGQASIQRYELDATAVSLTPSHAAKVLADLVLFTIHPACR